MADLGFPRRGDATQKGWTPTYYLKKHINEEVLVQGRGTRLYISPIPFDPPMVTNQNGAFPSVHNIKNWAPQRRWSMRCHLYFLSKKVLTPHLCFEILSTSCSFLISRDRTVSFVTKRVCAILPHRPVSISLDFVLRLISNKVITYFGPSIVKVSYSLQHLILTTRILPIEA